MAYSLEIREEELKNKVANDYFSGYDSTKIVGNIDFCIADKDKSQISYLWAEAKKGNSHAIYDSFVQLILTIGKERSFENSLPPPFLAAFDAEKIAFLPYHLIMDIFDSNDFNWNVAPSNHNTDEFNKVKELVLSLLETDLVLFKYANDKKQLSKFIKDNFTIHGVDISKIEITKNNFTSIYYRWLSTVKDTIGINWDAAKRKGIIDADFYLADMLSEQNATLKDKLFVLLRCDHYEFDRSVDEIMGTFSTTSASFKDGQKAHTQFWNLYRRPPKEEFWDFMVKRRDLLVPQDVRERKGSYFTPQKWVELSQRYLAAELGEDWQDEYYIWDCAAGTGNLLTGLTDKYRIWASTLDQSDVDIMKERINNGANLLESHVFKFDFLNDSFDNLPESLKSVISDKEKVKKLLVYINPPYAEHGNIRQIAGKGSNKTGVAKTNIYDRCQSIIGTGARELYAQFLYRIYTDLHGCKIGNFSKLKGLQGPYFKRFRQYFTAKLNRLFLMPANTFDNVKGKFPIGFFIWDTSSNEVFKSISADVYNSAGNFINRKTVNSYDDKKLVIEWLRKYYDTRNRPIGFLQMAGTDIQHRDQVFVTTSLSANAVKEKLYAAITPANLINMSIYYAIRQAIEPTWLNDRDHFLYPKQSWEEDYIFQTNCLIFAIFNNIARAVDGVNCWIPYSEQQVNAKDSFASHFMYDFLNGKKKHSNNSKKDGLFPGGEDNKLKYSDESLALLNSGKELYAYYHSGCPANLNASIHEIKEYFQGRDKNGKLNRTSSDEQYNVLIAKIKTDCGNLLSCIRPKVYEHGFLLR